MCEREGAALDPERSRIAPRSIAILNCIAQVRHDRSATRALAAADAAALLRGRYRDQQGHPVSSKAPPPRRGSSLVLKTKALSACGQSV